jgi:hypothetical protein
MVEELQLALERTGRGTQKPSCWAEAQSGKAEYIFDVALLNDGFRVGTRT